MQERPLVEDATIKLVVVARHRLDCDALSALLESHDGFQVICATTSADHAVAVCGRGRPHVIVLDAGLLTRDLSYDVAALLPVDHGVAILLLDESTHHRRLSCALRLPVVGYFIRSITGEKLAEAVSDLAAGRSTFDASIGNVMHHTSEGWRLRDRQHSPLSKLTPREIEVLRLLALGNSVRQCAAKLHLATSTVDNHKARLMKKLGVHKTAELVRFAVREGLIGD